MTRKSKRRGRERGARSREKESSPSSLLRASSLLLAAFVALVVARTLVPEDPGGQRGYGAPLDVLWLVLAGAWLLVQLRRGSLAFRFGAIDALVVALVGWHTVSALVAWSVGSPRPAMNMLWDWVAMGTLFLLARQLLTTPEVCRAVVVAMVGLACGLAVIAVHQSLVTIDADLRAYDAAKDSTEALYQLTYQWMPPDSSSRQQFEARLESRLPTATFALSNSLAGFLVPWCVVLVAVAVWRRGLVTLAVCCSMALLIMICIWLTGSRSAGIAVIAGLFLLVAGATGSASAFFRSVRALAEPVAPGGGTASPRLPRKKFWIAAGLLLAVVTVAIVLLATPFGRRATAAAWQSIEYRVEYWQATAAMIADYPIFGCGPGQFQDTYTAYKLPGASEEVQDPHNWLLEVWATAGTPAAIAMLVLVAVVVIRVARNGSRMQAAGSDQTSSIEQPAASGNAMLGGMAGVVLGTAIAWLSGFALVGTHIALLVVAIVGVGWLLRGWSRSSVMPQHVPLVAAAALLVNLLAAGGIGYPSVADSLWLLLAIGLNASELRGDAHDAVGSSVKSTRPTTMPTTPTGRAMGWITGLALVTVLMLAIRFEYLPVLSARLQLTLADEAVASGEAGLRRDALAAAVVADPWSATAVTRLAAQRFADYQRLTTDTQLERFRRADRRVRELAPRRSGVWAQSAEYAAAIYRVTDNVEYREEAERYFEQAIKLYPTDAQLHARSAKFWQLLGVADRARQAAAEALRLDDAIRARGHRDRQLDDALRRELELILGRGKEGE